ncbi:hypothetical protein [Aliiglaciecola lipolytica]|nr:hypothetical protein [Aliiglaciecola lipolytica]
MKFLKFILLISILNLVSCYRIHHDPHGTMYFSVSNSNKSELIQVLDEFAEENTLAKIQEGGERMLPEKMKVHVHAIYENDDNYQIAVQNFLNASCYSASAYDFDKIDSKVATNLAEKLQHKLLSEFEAQITFYTDQYCKQAI